MLDKIRAFPARVASFSSDVRAELRKVTWPSKKEVYGTTIVVIVTVFFYGFYLFLADTVLQMAISRVFQIFL